MFGILVDEIGVEERTGVGLAFWNLSVGACVEKRRGDNGAYRFGECHLLWLGCFVASSSEEKREGEEEELELFIMRKMR